MTTRRTPPPIADRPWCNLSEAGQWYGLHRTTIARLVRSGDIPEAVTAKFGNRIRINRVALEQWLANRPINA